MLKLRTEKRVPPITFAVDENQLQAFKLAESRKCDLSLLAGEEAREIGRGWQTRQFTDILSDDSNFLGVSPIPTAPSAREKGN